MEYRVMTVTGCGTHSLVRIQRARTHFGWVTVWQQPYRKDEEDYALRCAQDLVDHLNEKI